MRELIAGAQDLQISLRTEHLEALRRYQDLLLTWNDRFNLTAITDDTGIQIRHFLDSLSCLLALESGERFGGKRVIDVGTGAGFPGIPLKILCPNIKLTLLEATKKKTRFLQQVVDELGLRDVTVIHGRAEAVGQDPAHREQYHWALARAVADLPILMEYLLPFLQVNGRALAQKGESAPAEVHRTNFAFQQLGGQLRQLIPVDLRGINETRYLVLVDKVAATPAKYPRRPGMPGKYPLASE
ncbi:MAG: 16S rRNA (guanine(527)-N(7))-methyltransferase RsmG [Anaerolineae bacterium]|nr:16S rRNA (guanine(527)-N(7))-methyltransferase RsmG [Anaerolineae bacterium]